MTKQNLMVKNWSTMPLQRLLHDAQSGFASGERCEDGIIQVRMNNVTTEGYLDWTGFIRIPASQEQISKYCLFPGDVLFNSTNSPELVGKTTIFNGYPEPVVFSNHFLRLCVDKTRLDPHYLARWLTSQWKQRTFENLCTSWVNQAAVRKEDLLSLHIPLPPIHEQKRLASILDKASRLLHHRRYALELSSTYLQVVFLEMFGGSSHQHETVTIEDVASKKRYALSSGPFGSNLTSLHYTGSGVVVLRGLNVSRGEINLSDVKYISEEKAKELFRSEVNPGDVVVVAVGTSGFACQIPPHLLRAILSQNFNKITPDTEQIDPTYLEYLINSSIVQKQLSQEITDTVRTFLSLTKLKTIKIPLPPLPLQQKFAQIVQQYERLRAQQREAERQAEHLFQTLLHKAFQGELSTQEADEQLIALEAGVQRPEPVMSIPAAIDTSAYQLALPLE